MFDLIPRVLETAKRDNPQIAQKWTTWSDAPADNKYNYDEKVRRRFYYGAPIIIGGEAM